MAKVSFSKDYTQNKTAFAEKVKVQYGETDRIGIVTAPERFYVHQITMPIVDPATGEVEQETLNNAKGEAYQRDKNEFVGSYLCTGKEEAIGGPDGFDPDNCMLCAAIKEHGDTKFRRPEPKYACWVIKYRVNSNDEVQLDPFQVELLLWVMTQHRFDMVVRIANEHGDPMKLDLLLGPCKNTQFQAYDIAAGGKCYWREDNDRMKLVASLLKANKVDSEEGETLVKNTIARSYTPTSAEMTINKVLERHAQIGVVGSSAPSTSSSVDFGGAGASKGTSSSFSESLKASESDSKASSGEEAPKAPEQPESGSEEPVPGEDDSVEDFESIFASLNG